MVGRAGTGDGRIARRHRACRFALAQTREWVQTVESKRRVIMGRCVALGTNGERNGARVSWRHLIGPRQPVPYCRRFEPGGPWTDE
jgi:hypothetical protein